MAHHVPHYSCGCPCLSFLSLALLSHSLSLSLAFARSLADPISQLLYRIFSLLSFLSHSFSSTCTFLLACLSRNNRKNQLQCLTIESDSCVNTGRTATNFRRSRIGYLGTRPTLPPTCTFTRRTTRPIIGPCRDLAGLCFE
jgi:hypothetical protein